MKQTKRTNEWMTEWMNEWMNGIEWNRSEWLVKLKKNYKNKYERVSEWEEIEKIQNLFNFMAAVYEHK